MRGKLVVDGLWRVWHCLDVSCGETTRGMVMDGVPFWKFWDMRSEFIGGVLAGCFVMVMAVITLKVIFWIIEL